MAGEERPPREGEVGSTTYRVGESTYQYGYESKTRHTSSKHDTRCKRCSNSSTEHLSYWGNTMAGDERPHEAGARQHHLSQRIREAHTFIETQGKLPGKQDKH